MFHDHKIILITGACGFIGSALTRRILNNESNIKKLVLIDKLTYAHDPNSHAEFINHPKVEFYKSDISSEDEIFEIINKTYPTLVFNFAAESHVDNSIDSPSEFMQTNISGTFSLLESIRKFNKANSQNITFFHISTDEVYGDLADCNYEKFSECSPFKPSSPYSASKAASDHLVQAWARTYDLDTIITNCSNNYGPHQHSEKLIPKTILACINREEIPIYGLGNQIRDWLYVEDHIEALIDIVNTHDGCKNYCVGGNSPMTNLDVVHNICDYFTNITADDFDFRSLISLVSDRPGHDLKYSIDTSKIYNEIGWKPKHSFSKGISLTIEWFIDNYDKSKSV